MDLLRIFDYSGPPSETNKFLFLGDYVDRGYQSTETIILLLCYKIKYPKSLFLLRGNHESADINQMYGFYDEYKVRYKIGIWKQFQDCFNCLPVAAVIGERIFCAHGGCAYDCDYLSEIEEIKRPSEVPDKGIMCDLLWSDPSDND